ncbi:hypothetical protein EK21DRAFT_112461 [Setomelanomma holmii]|uniref:Extracellular membrane protein CFEM domain-containing protein n=1 Tax=Setomelanomma holmii TaxID=210430 RepID=A0A9P4H9G4_9PLEO|nr:hypothetical protein EK21DRAFT_112461 [Setomelanomma holmii]
MKCIGTSLALMAAAIPTIVAFPMTTFARQYIPPTCGVDQCLAGGLFDGCKPADLGCLCSLEQDEVTRYVSVVQPCIDGAPGKDECTAGAIAQYKQLLRNTCDQQFCKTAIFPET